MSIQVFSDLIFQNIEVNIVFVTSSGHTDSVTEVVDGFSRISSSSHTVNGKYSRIVPTLNSIRENKFMKLSFRQDVIGNI